MHNLKTELKDRKYNIAYNEGMLERIAVPIDDELSYREHAIKIVDQ